MRPRSDVGIEGTQSVTLRAPTFVELKSDLEDRATRALAELLTSSLASSKAPSINTGIPANVTPVVDT